MAAIIILSLILLSGCKDENNPVIETPTIIGSWKILEATKDDVIQEAWKNKIITFSASSTEAGDYTLLSSPDETILKSEGEWKYRFSYQTVLIDESVSITYQFSESNASMSMVFIVTDDEEMNCDTQPCVPVVLGRWTINLQRNQ